jgi:DNA-binding CsgD family transcriptional regulator
MQLVDRAQALGLLDVGSRPLLARLAERRQLLVLDNVEQVLLVAALLADLQGVAGRRERLACGEGEWAAAHREGRVLPFSAVATLILRLLEEAAQALPQADVKPVIHQSPVQPSQHPDQSPLTAREQEVLRLVAQGLSNKAIGRQLFLAPSTVNHHLTSIFTKLSVNTRAQAVAMSLQSGYVQAPR